MPACPHDHDRKTFPDPSLDSKRHGVSHPPVTQRDLKAEIANCVGGVIIPAFVDSLDAYSDTIGGYTAARVDEPLSNFDYEHFYFT